MADTPGDKKSSTKADSDRKSRLGKMVSALISSTTKRETHKALRNAAVFIVSVVAIAKYGDVVRMD